MSARKSQTVQNPPTEALLTRSSRNLFIVVALLALVGLADAVYLTVKHFTGGIVPCSLTQGCEQVLNSQYATIGGLPIIGLVLSNLKKVSPSLYVMLAGIPLAAVGAFAYFCVFSLATLAIFGTQAARRLLFYLVLLMLLFSIWLFIVQAFMLHAFCQFCLLSATTTLLLSIVVTLERFQSTKKERRIKQ
jgi:uncharacterized membrane protein